jgi:hypothetical protein
MLRAGSSATSSGSSSAMDTIRMEMKQLNTVLAKPGGARNLFRGLYLLLLRDSYATGVFLGSYESLRRWCLDSGHSNLIAGLVAGAVAGPLGWIACYPIEIVRIHWQQADPKRWSSVVGCARHIYQTGGPGAFFRGLPLCCARSALQISVTMMMFESILEYKTEDVVP